MLTDSDQLKDTDQDERQYQVAHAYQQEVLVADLLAHPPESFQRNGKTHQEDHVKLAQELSREVQGLLLRVGFYVGPGYPHGVDQRVRQERQYVSQLGFGHIIFWFGRLGI